MTQVAIQLPDELSQFVDKSVKAGEYPSTDDFFISVVSMYKEQVEERLSGDDEAKVESLRRDIQHAADQLDRGEGIEIDWDAKMAKLRGEYAARHSGMPHHA